MAGCHFDWGSWRRRVLDAVASELDEGFWGSEGTEGWFVGLKGSEARVNRRVFALLYNARAVLEKQ